MKSYKRNFKIKSTGVSNRIDPQKKKWIILAAILSALLIIGIVIAVVVTQQLKNAMEEVLSQEANTISYITIRTRPDTNFIVGEDPDYTGLTVIVVWGDYSQTIVGPDACTITGFDSSEVAKNQEITVTYQGHSCTYTVNINEPPTEPPTIVGVEMAVMPDKTEYTLEEWLASGMEVAGGKLTIKWSDDTTTETDLLYRYLSGVSKINTPGEHVVTVKYRVNPDDSVYYTTTFTITVTE